MDWLELLDSVLALQGVGMSVPMALEQHAYFGSGSSQMIAQQWLAQRQIGGDDVAAMEVLASGTRAPSDRLAAESLILCMTYPCSDHRQTLAVTAEEIARDRRSAHRPGPAGLAALMLLGPTVVELTRVMMVGLE